MKWNELHSILDSVRHYHSRLSFFPGLDEEVFSSGLDEVSFNTRLNEVMFFNSGSDELRLFNYRVNQYWTSWSDMIHSL